MSFCCWLSPVCSQPAPVVMRLFHPERWDLANQPEKSGACSFTTSPDSTVKEVFFVFFCVVINNKSQYCLGSSLGNCALKFPCMTSLSCEMPFQDVILFIYLKKATDLKWSGSGTHAASFNACNMQGVTLGFQLLIFKIGPNACCNATTTNQSYHWGHAFITYHKTQV